MRDSFVAHVLKNTQVPPLINKSVFHRLAWALEKGEVQTSLAIDLCIEVGLIWRAQGLADDYGVTRLRYLQQLKLARLRGDVGALVELGQLDSIRRHNLLPRDVREAARILAAADPALVVQLREQYGRWVDCYLAVLARTRPAEAKRQLSRSFFFSSPDFCLLKSNLAESAAAASSSFRRYFAGYGVGLGSIEFERFLAKPALRSIAGSVPGSSKAGGVSIVVTTHNCARYLSGAIASLLNQTVCPYEIIVVDDASSDETVALLGSLANRYPLIKPVFLSTNVGTYRAKNVGLKLAQGDYVAFQDADDWSHPRRLELCAQQIARNSHLIAVSCLYVRRSTDGTFTSPRVWPLTQWSPNTVFFDRRKIAAAGMEMDATRIGGDSEFVARLKFFFGDSSHSKLRIPLLVAAHRSDSLMTASLTGLDKHGRSAVRSNYQNDWAEQLLLKARRQLGYWI